MQQRDWFRRLSQLTMVVILVSSGAAPVHGEPTIGEGSTTLDRYWRSCPLRGDADSGGRYSLVFCGEHTFALADAELNRIYQDRMRGLQSARQKTLRTSQRMWLASRDRKAKQCSYPWTPVGREYPLQFAICRPGATVARTDAIRRWK